MSSIVAESTTTSRKRVIIIGLDGATPLVMRPLAEQGIMPTVKQLMDEGAWGTLMSTVPPVTGPAWCSFATGKQPGNHGVFDFFKPTKANNAIGISRRLINSKEVDGKTIWHLFSEHDLKVIVMNVPVTYPPRPVNGVMFTGMLTPSADGDLTYPPGVYQKHKAELGEYIISVNWQGYTAKTADGFVRDVIQAQRQRTKYCLKMMDEHPDWNLCFPCYTGVDRIQHAMWNYIDPAEREKLKKVGRFNPAFLELVYDYYRQVDEDIRRIRDKAGHDVPVFFASDHGFGPLYGKVYVNDFLAEKGLLVYDKAKIRNAMIGLLGKKVFLKGLKTLGLKKMYAEAQAKKAAERGSAAARTFYDVFYEAIDWTKTKAYMASNTEGGLYINLKGRKLYRNDLDIGCVDPRDYERVREEVVAALREIRHPDTGKPMLSHVKYREEVYHGKYIERAPDIVFFLDDGEWIADFLLGKGRYKRADWRTGCGMHRMEGFFLAHGAGVARNPNVTCTITDVVPTILAYLGLPIPRDMDGRFVDEAFTDAWKATHQVTRSDRDAVEQGSGWGEGAGVYNEEDEAVLVERLRGLGYID